MDEIEDLYQIAQIAVTVAGFASVVAVFKQRSDGSWSHADADRFNGMLIHSITALFFCFLPSLISAFIDDPHRVWSICSLLLAVQLLLHSLVIGLLPTSKWQTRIGLLPALLLGAGMIFNVWGDSGLAEFPLYAAGILWHTFQASALFLMLTFIRDEKIS
jgi:hypothetical protein